MLMKLLWFSWIRVKRPMTISNAAGLSYSVPSPSSSSVPSPFSRAEQALPLGLRNLFEFSSLEGSGVQVKWPEGIIAQIAHDLIFDVFSLMIDRGEDKEGEVEEAIVPHVSSSSSSNRVLRRMTSGEAVEAFLNSG